MSLINQIYLNLSMSLSSIKCSLLGLKTKTLIILNSRANVVWVVCVIYKFDDACMRVWDSLLAMSARGRGRRARRESGARARWWIVARA